MNFVLIGYRCTGKTSAGERAAALLGMDFIDTDAMVLASSGRQVSEIVAAGGWEAFREKEKEVILSLPEKGEHIISLGGGAVLDPENVAELRRREGVFIWLFADAETIARRLCLDGASAAQRPELGGPEKSLPESIRERVPYYRGLADYIVDTSDRSLDEIAGRLCEFIKKYQGR